MSAKWTEEQREKFKRTMAAKAVAKREIAKAIAERPRARRRAPHEAEDFARFMAAAWKLYKSGR